MKNIIKKHFNDWGFQAFKCLIYLLLSINLYQFFTQELLASKVVFASGISLTTFIEGFPMTIDTFSWFVLLLLFELETYVLEDNVIKGKVKLALHGFRILCYSFILYAFYGYLTKLGLLEQFAPFKHYTLCGLTDNWQLMTDLDEYQLISKQNCEGLVKPSEEIFAIADHQVITTTSALMNATLLAWVDVINAGAWIIVAIMIEVNVHTQLEHVDNKVWDNYQLLLKKIVYSILIVCAIFYGVKGNFVDFWDAFVWLVAFFFIEQNIFAWQEEIELEYNNTHSA